MITVFSVFGDYFLDHFDLSEIEINLFYRSFKLDMTIQCEQMDNIRDFWTARKYLEAETLYKEEMRITERAPGMQARGDDMAYIRY